MADILETIAESNREIVRKNKEIKSLNAVMDEAFARGKGDFSFEKALAKESAVRKICADILFEETTDGYRVSMTDEAKPLVPLFSWLPVVNHTM